MECYCLKENIFGVSAKPDEEEEQSDNLFRKTATFCKFDENSQDQSIKKTWSENLDRDGNNHQEDNQARLGQYNPRAKLMKRIISERKCNNQANAFSRISQQQCEIPKISPCYQDDTIFWSRVNKVIQNSTITNTTNATSISEKFNKQSRNYTDLTTNSEKSPIAIDTSNPTPPSLQNGDSLSSWRLSTLSKQREQTGLTFVKNPELNENSPKNLIANKADLELDKKNRFIIKSRSKQNIMAIKIKNIIALSPIPPSITQFLPEKVNTRNEQVLNEYNPTKETSKTHYNTLVASKIQSARNCLKKPDTGGRNSAFMARSTNPHFPRSYSAKTNLNQTGKIPLPNCSAIPPSFTILPGESSKKIPSAESGLLEFPPTNQQVAASLNKDEKMLELELGNNVPMNAQNKRSSQILLKSNYEIQTTFSPAHEKKLLNDKLSEHINIPIDNAIQSKNPETITDNEKLGNDDAIVVSMKKPPRKSCCINVDIESIKPDNAGVIEERGSTKLILSPKSRIIGMRNNQKSLLMLDTAGLEEKAKNKRSSSRFKVEELVIQKLFNIPDKQAK